MRALVVYCHPREGSFTAAVRDTVLERLEAAGAEVRLTDLYARGFSPALTAEEHAGYEDEATNQAPVRRDCDDLMWCDTLIFVYPTWWYGQPAVLKGWIDRVFVPGIAFRMPTPKVREIRPGLTHITRLGCFTTCGASWWLTRMIGAPGRRTILRGVRNDLAPPALVKTAFRRALPDGHDPLTPASRRPRNLAQRRPDRSHRFLGVPAPATAEAAAWHPGGSTEASFRAPEFAEGGCRTQPSPSCPPRRIEAARPPPAGGHRHLHRRGHARDAARRLPRRISISASCRCRRWASPNEHLFAAGTLTLSRRNGGSRPGWEIGLSVARAGVRRLVIVNSHGGNLDLVSDPHARVCGCGRGCWR